MWLVWCDGEGVQVVISGCGQCGVMERVCRWSLVGVVSVV